LFYKKYQSYGITIDFYPYIADENKTLAATCLLEGSAVLNNDITVWEIFTSNNYKILSPFALELSYNEKMLKNAVAQMNLRLAAAKWEDFWGHLLGVDRYTSELLEDLSYKTRIQNELTSPKVNNIALNLLLNLINKPRITVSDGGVALNPPALNSPAYSTDPTGYTNAVFTAGSNLMKIPSGQTISFEINEGDKINGDGDPNPIQEETFIVKFLGDQGSGEKWFVMSRPSTLTITSAVKINAYSKTFALTLPVVGTAYGIAQVTASSTSVSIIHPQNNIDPNIGLPQGYFTPLRDFQAENFAGYTADPMLNEVLPLTVATPFPSHFQLEKNNTNPIEGGVGTYTATSSPAVSSTQEVYGMPFGYSITNDLNAYKMGPITGSGTFLVTIDTNGGKLAFTQEEYARLLAMIAKYKPAGIGFDIITV
jgi:hypothetical protein